MKKFSNIVLIIALSLVVLGNLLYWGPKVYKYFKNDEIHQNIGSSDQKTEGFIDSIEAAIQSADVNIVLSDSISCSFENVDLSTSEAYVSEGILHITAKNYENMEILGWNIGDVIDKVSKAKVTIYVTEDILRSIKLEVGSGTIDIGNMNAENLVIQLGAGNLSVTGLNVTGNGAIQVGSGTAKIYSLDAQKLSIKTGAGSIDVRLSDADKFGISSSIATGSVDVLNVSKCGINQSITKAGDGTKQLTIEGGVGTISVR